MFERVQHGRSDLYYADEAGVEEIANANILNLGDRVYCVSNDTMYYAGFDGLYDENGVGQVPFSNAQVISLDNVSEGNDSRLLRAQEGSGPNIGVEDEIGALLPPETVNSLFKLIEVGGNGRLWYAMEPALETLSEYLDFADRVYVINEGKVLMWTGEDYVEDLTTGSSITTDTATTTSYDAGQPLIPSN